MKNKLLIILSFAYFCILPSSNGRSLPGDGIPVRAVNLGGWLVTEGWIKPSLFDAIPNKDFLDGTGVQLKSVTAGKYLCAESGGGTIIVANRSSASGWETFSLWRINETTFNLRVFNKQFVGMNSQGNGIDIVAVANTPGLVETFEIERNPNDLNRVRIRATNGFYLQAKTEELVTADHEGNGGWGDDNPSVFLLEISGRLQGEYQITNGYGPLAPQVMKEHWSTYIVEDDFKFIKKNGLNAVRIPVGWWIASDPNPPKPYVGGSLQALDNAFSWAEKYGIRVIIDLHAAPGSQNGWEHSSSRDGSQEWGQTDANIQQTVDVIDFLTARYAKSPSLFAVELINEPLSPGVALDTLTKYYKAGLEAVRRHSTTAYVILSNRLGPHEPRELFDLANGFTKVAIDVHYYNLFSSIFDNLSVQQNIDYVYNNRTEQLSEITTSNGPLVFVGEWVAEWQVSGAAIRYIDSRHYRVPRGDAAVELLSGDPSGVRKELTYTQTTSMYTLNFTLGDANDSCVGDFIVYVEVGSSVHNFTIHSNGTGTTFRYSLRFRVEPSQPMSVSFYSFNETRTKEGLLCGPVLDSIFLGSNGERMRRRNGILGSNVRRRNGILVLSSFITFLIMIVF